ncbi:MAG: tetratricopeptide repeat protein [Microscillaceae bacterium]|jgi:serine phosphatase RsbU (regulator of sigma subunit)|nr:tetratricopeptide repeat protein [Microscillaceae bacterium]
MKFLSIFFLSLSITLHTLAQSSKIDSLLLLLQKQTINDSTKLKTLGELSAQYRKVNPSKSIYYAEKALIIAEKIKDWQGVAYSHRLIGGIHRLQGNYDQALTAYFASLKVCEKYELKDDIAKALNNIGLVYRSQKNLEEALHYHQKSLSLAQALKDNELIANNLNNIGLIYRAKNQIDDCIESTRQALRIYQKIKHQEGIINATNNIGKAFEKADKLDSALYYYQNVLALAEKSQNINLISENLVSIASVYSQQPQKTELAMPILEKSLQYARQMNNKEREMDIYKIFSEIYEEKGDESQALLFYKKSVAIKDSLFTKEKNHQIAQIQVSYESEKKDQELALKNSEIKQQALLRNFLIIGILAFVGVIVWLIRNNRQKQLLNKKLDEQKQEILVQNEELLQQQEEILTHRDFIEAANQELAKQNAFVQKSIQSASTIQKAVLPSELKMTNILNQDNFFLINLPRDIVSGDFYWVDVLDNQTFIVLADCTGHGVAGAFMSMIGTMLLNKVILEEKTREPHLILEKLHQNIFSALDQAHSKDENGMEIAVCRIEKTNNGVQLKFAGAKRMMYYFEVNQLIFNELVENRRAIGGSQENPPAFESQQIELNLPAYIYLCSDGFADQNNLNRKKFGEKNLFELLKNASQLPFTQQKNTIWQALQNHQNTAEQRDDILFMGIKIS